MPTAAVPQIAFTKEASNYDEASMHQSLLFADSLKDLKNLRTQLYSAAKYFELSFTNDEQEHMRVLETLKDYTIKALVNTVDHLGSVSYKVNDVLGDKIVEACAADLRISCIEQRLRTCEIYMNHEGRAQQSSAVCVPKYHKRYNLPADETLKCATHTTCTKFYNSSTDDGDPIQLKIALGMTPEDTPTLTSQQQGGHFYSNPASKADIVDKRTVSPLRLSLFRSGSLAGTTATLNPSKSITSSIYGRQDMSEPRKSTSMRFYADENRIPRDSQHHQQGKSKRLLKALLSRRKSRKDDMLYTFLDEY